MTDKENSMTEKKFILLKDFYKVKAGTEIKKELRSEYYHFWGKINKVEGVGDVFGYIEFDRYKFDLYELENNPYWFELVVST